MKPPKVRWSETIPGLHYCIVGDSSRIAYHFQGYGDGTGTLYEGEGFDTDPIIGRMDLKRAEDYVKLDVFYKWMEENQHIWTRADK